MTLRELAEEYKQSARMVRARQLELEARLRLGGMSETERLLLRGRISGLRAMYRDTREAASVMEHYYDRGYKRNGRYTV